MTEITCTPNLLSQQKLATELRAILASYTDNYEKQATINYDESCLTLELSVCSGTILHRLYHWGHENEMLYYVKSIYKKKKAFLSIHFFQGGAYLERF